MADRRQPCSDLFGSRLRPLAPDHDERGDVMAWDPNTYIDDILVEVPGYAEFQERVAAATRGIEAVTVLELGIGLARRHVACLRITRLRSRPQSTRAQRCWSGRDPS